MGVFFIYDVQKPDATNVLVALALDLHLFFLLWVDPEESVNQCFAYVLWV